jgi:hypothetical protein
MRFRPNPAFRNYPVITLDVSRDCADFPRSALEIDPITLHPLPSRVFGTLRSFAVTFSGFVYRYGSRIDPIAVAATSMSSSLTELAEPYRESAGVPARDLHFRDTARLACVPRCERGGDLRPGCCAHVGTQRTPYTSVAVGCQRINKSLDTQSLDPV